MDTLIPEPDTHRACRSQPVDVTSLHPSPTNPRKTFAGERFDQMVQSVRDNGVIQPLLLRVWPANQPIAATYAHGFPAYEIVAGERRYRAALAAGIEVVPGLVRDLDDRQVVELQMVENLQREDLVELEEAEGYHLMMRDYGYTADDLAARIGKSKAYIYGRLKLLDLCEKARDAVRSGEIPASIGLLIARIPAKALQMQALADVSQGEMSARTAAAHVRARYMLELKSAPFPRDDAQLLPKAGTCTDCPKRTGNQVDLFSDVANADVCTDPDCYRDKRTAHMRREQAKIEARGGKVISGKEAEELMPYGEHYIGGGFVKATDTCYEGAPDDKGNYPTYAQLAKRAGIEPVVVANETKGLMVKAVNKADLKKALKAAGEAAPESHDDKAKTEEKKRKAEQAYRLQLYTEILGAIAPAAERDPHAVLDSAHLRLIARRMYDGVGWEAQNKFAHFWVSKEDATEAHARTAALGFLITSMTDAQLVLLMLDCCVGGSIAVPSYTNDYTTPAHLTELAARWGIDAAALRKDMAAEARAKAKGTKAGTAKKAPTQTKKQKEDAAYKQTLADFTPGTRVEVIKEVSSLMGLKIAVTGDLGTVIETIGHETKIDLDNKTGVVGFRTHEVLIIEKAPADTVSPLTTGDRVRVLVNAKSEGGKVRKCAGREGTVEEQHGAYFSVRFGPRPHEVVANLTRDELEKLPDPMKAARAAESSAPEAPADPAAFAIGDRVRIVLAECKACGDEAEVICLPEPTSAGCALKLRVVTGPRKGKTYLLLPTDLEKLPAAEPAAPAGDTTPAPKPAARARKSKAPKQAAGAASENEAPVERCEKTVDIFSGKAAIEEGAAA